MTTLFAIWAVLSGSYTPESARDTLLALVIMTACDLTTLVIGFIIGYSI